MFLNPPFDPNRFSTSWLFKANLLTIIRGIISLYIFSSIIAKLSYYAATNEKILDGQDFSYFTSLTFWGLAFYFAFAALHSWTYWRSGTPALARWGSVLGQLHSILYSTIVVFPFIVTIVYWAILFDYFASRFEAWSNVSQHALNSVFALFELVFARTEPMPWIHLLYLIVLLALYLAVAFITYGTEHFYVYSFLDNRTHGRGRVAGYIFGILAAAIVIFVIVHFLILGRQKLTERNKNRASLEHKHERSKDVETEVGKAYAS